MAAESGRRKDSTGHGTDSIVYDLGTWTVMDKEKESFNTVSLAPKDLEVIELPESTDDKPLQTRYAFVDEKRSKKNSSGVQLVASEPYVAATETNKKPENGGEWADYAFLVRRTFDSEERPRDVLIDIQSTELHEAIRDVFWEPNYITDVQVYVASSCSQRSS